MDMHSLCRTIAAEGAVLLKNEDGALPLTAGTRVAVFGRAQTFYYKSGTGSGGLVHIDHEPCVIESLQACEALTLDADLIAQYAAWVQTHPFSDGGGEWASEPWFQEEMPIADDDVAAAAARNDAAVIVFARTAGEDHDNADTEGGYRLTAEEERLLSTVTAHFSRVIVALNVGNLIDTSFMERYPVSSLLYLWQGGMEGANAFADLLCGQTSPGGKLTDTVTYQLADVPSNAHFGDRDKNIYAEDVYVGYRYFETFAPDKVQYPFGFGLTYTTFDTAYTAVEADGEVTVTAIVRNTGAYAAKDTLQVYVQSPCGKLGTPTRRLAAFAKTPLLQPGESATVCARFALADIASYDDGGVTGHRSCYVLEAGEYTVFAGTDVRAAQAVLTVTVNELTVTQRWQEAMAPVEAFERWCAVERDGKRVLALQPVPTATVDLEARIAANRPEAVTFTGDRGYKLRDVADGGCSMDDFIAQLSDDDLAALTCGEGMNSPKATPGTGGALGGQTESLSAFGIPVCAVTDGPSGIRLDTGDKASSIPNGTLLASTWDVALVEELYSGVGEELKANHVDALLGPGINIHRHPLCGRNFEYYSEDPVLTGRIAAAVTRGIAAHGAFSTIKHFCANNQETNRYGCESVVSERALREIYLKPFEIAVREGENVLIMTAYNPVNGYWTASHYDLTATVLRGEWGFDNFVMTDWWAKCNLTCHGDGNGAQLQAMVRAAGDVYMVCEDAAIKCRSVLDGLRDGYITKGELQRCAKTICSWILRTQTFAEYCENGCVPKYPIAIDESAMTPIVTLADPSVDQPTAVTLRGGKVLFAVTLTCQADVLAQVPVTVWVGEESFVASVCGTNGQPITVKRCVSVAEDGDYAVSVSHNDTVTVHAVDIKQ